MNRRNLLQLGGAASMLPFLNVAISNASTVTPAVNRPNVNMTSDGRFISPVEYAELLQKLINENPDMGDRYGSGGAVAKLEDEIIKTTGKEAAVFMPSGTLANQLAIKVLSGDKTKVFVQDQSHVYRDESDAAQLIHDKRLMPLAPNAANFTLEDLQAAIAHYRRNEVFETGIGAISIENTVRRRHEEIFDIDEIRKISEFARRQGIGMHLDGARLFMASTWSGVSIEEYARHFDTVYISLYKYFGAGAGAVLAGTKQTIDTVRKWMKPYGTVMFQNWHNALIALHVFDGFEKTVRYCKKSIAGIVCTTQQNRRHPSRDFSTRQ